MYFPLIRYEDVVPGATFTVREGGRIVGFGRVESRTDPTGVSDQQRFFERLEL